MRCMSRLCSCFYTSINVTKAQHIVIVEYIYLRTDKRFWEHVHTSVYTLLTTLPYPFIAFLCKLSKNFSRTNHIKPLTLCSLEESKNNQIKKVLDQTGQSDLKQHK